MIKAHNVILLGCVLIHIQPVIYNSWITDATTSEERFSLRVARALALLTYPACGWLAEVCIGHAKMIKCSFVVSLMGSVFAVMSSVFLVFSDGRLGTIFSVLTLIASLAGLAMFEANAIQLAMDEMIEASSEQLSSFIHWYFWCCNLGILFVFYSLSGGILYLSECQIRIDVLFDKTMYQKQFNYLSGLVLVTLCAFQILFLCFGLKMNLSNLRVLYQQRPRNSLKIIFKVLKYSYQHKYPERRSAFTYWENDTPSRIDLGKEKYGGPFTYEQVEDVKTFFRLLLLILSLFGYHLLGEGYSLSYYIMNTFGCPTITPLLLIIANPKHIPTLATLVGIPLLELIGKYSIQWCRIDMLTKLWFGLLLSLLAEATQVLLSLLLEPREFNCPEATIYFGYSGSLLQKCLLANINYVVNGTCNHLCTDPTVSTDLYKIYLAIIPLTLYGISYLLIFMTTLEFICAQSPNSVKGLLIGIWYSLLSIKYLTTSVLDEYSPWLETIQWTVYNGVKGVEILLSILLYSILYKFYHYRERNEIVNEQTIIEDQFARELLKNHSSEDDSSSESNE